MKECLSWHRAIKGKTIPAVMRSIELDPLETPTIPTSYPKLANARGVQVGRWINRDCLRNRTLWLSLLLPLHTALDRGPNLRGRFCPADADGVSIRPDETESVQEFEE